MQPVATATALAVKAVNAAGASNKPKQTLEEMAAWLDAQLAAAPGNSRSLYAPLRSDEQLQLVPGTCLCRLHFAVPRTTV